MKSALEITSGQELLTFNLGTFVDRHTRYTILTGYENTGACWWCGSPIIGRRSKHYCTGHRDEYLRHFEWRSAAHWCRQRAHHQCELCGIEERKIPTFGGYSISGYRVHHIVPINGADRFFSVFNLPWNLVALCHTCHMEVHAAMREENKIQSKYERAISAGQGILFK